MTTDNTATSWRDLADQLTGEQIAELEYFERAQVPPGLDDPGHYLNHARKMAELNLVRAMYADIPAPADAVDISEWIDWGDGEYQRVFTVWSCHQDTVSVDVFGHQFSSGAVTERSIVDSGDDDAMTAAQARARAAALTAAADECDLFGSEGPTD